MLLGRFKPLYPEFLDSKSRKSAVRRLALCAAWLDRGQDGRSPAYLPPILQAPRLRVPSFQAPGLPNPLNQLLQPALQFLDPQRRHRFPRQAYPTVFALTHRSFRSYTPRVYRRNSPYRRIAVNLGDIYNSTAPAHGKVCLPSQFKRCARSDHRASGSPIC
jgi:hypothetical protein